MICNSFPDITRRGLAILVVGLATVTSASPVLAQEPAAEPAEPAIEASGDRALPAVAVPDDGTGVTAILAARRFSLDTPYRTSWGVGNAEVTAGWILALEVGPRFVRPRQTRAPVLYVGTQLAERFHPGVTDGVLVVVVPDRAGEPTVDLAEALLFFGTPMLPERVDPERAKEEERAARAGGILPLPEAKRATPEASSFQGTDRAALHALVAEWIGRFARGDAAFAEALVAPSSEE